MASQWSEVRHPSTPEADPLAEILSLLRPEALVCGLKSGAGELPIRYRQYEEFAFCLVLVGTCFIKSDDMSALLLSAGDFVLVSQKLDFTISSGADGELTREAAPIRDKSFLERSHHELRLLDARFRLGHAAAPTFVRLLPSLVHIRRQEPGADCIHRIVDAVIEEVNADRPGRQLVVERLLDVLLVEALRFRRMFGTWEPGLLPALSDPALERAIRHIHGDVTRNWTVAELADATGLCRADFAKAFASKLGLPPLQYVMDWRMAIARDMLGRQGLSRTEVAERVGYQSANAFSTAFARVVGCSPNEFARSSAACLPDGGADAMAAATHRY